MMFFGWFYRNLAWGLALLNLYVAIPQMPGWLAGLQMFFAGFFVAGWLCAMERR